MIRAFCSERCRLIVASKERSGIVASMWAASRWRNVSVENPLTSDILDIVRESTDDDGP